MIGFSSFGVLSYYAIANMAAFTQPAADRRWPRALNLLGILGCLTLVATLPLPAVITGALLLTGGLIGRLLVLRLGQRRQEQSSTPRERGTPQ